MNEQEKSINSTKCKRIICIKSPCKKNKIKNKLYKFRKTIIDLNTGDKINQITIKTTNKDNILDIKKNKYVYYFMYPKDDRETFIEINEVERQLEYNTVVNFNGIKKEGRMLYAVSVSWYDIINHISLLYFDKFRSINKSFKFDNEHSKMIITYDKNLAERASSICKLLSDYMMKYYKYMIKKKRVISFLDAFYEMNTGKPIESNTLNDLMYDVYKYIFRPIEHILQTIYKALFTEENDIKCYIETDYDSVFLIGNKFQSYQLISYTDLARGNYEKYVSLEKDLFNAFSDCGNYRMDNAIKNLIHINFYDKEKYFNIL